MTLRSRPGLVSLRSRPEMDVATWLELARLGLKSRHHFEVTTWVAVGEVATWIFGVATWESHCGQKRGRDIKLMS